MMLRSLQFNRRSLLQGGTAFAALKCSMAPALAAPAIRLPARANVVIRNAYVMTMEAGDIKDGDVHVKDGVIAAVGQKLNVAGAATINAAGMIVLPGLIETHWHMCNGLLRSMSGDKPDLGYFRTTAALGQKYEPSDMYQGTRLAAAEAITSGITFVHDWCHNIRAPAYADQDLQALRESGARSLFLRSRAGDAKQSAHSDRRPRTAQERLGELFQWRPDHAGIRLAWHGRQQSCDGDSSGNL
jgi:cytosine/adenosine deaminase-related metal-dependent hydrolase